MKYRIVKNGLGEYFIERNCGGFENREYEIMPGFAFRSGDQYKNHLLAINAMKAIIRKKKEIELMTKMQIVEEFEA